MVARTGIRLFGFVLIGRTKGYRKQARPNHKRRRHRSASPGMRMPLEVPKHDHSPLLQLQPLSQAVPVSTSGAVPHHRGVRRHRDFAHRERCSTEHYALTCIRHTLVHQTVASWTVPGLRASFFRWYDSLND